MKRAAKLSLLAALFLLCAAAALFRGTWERRHNATPPVELYAVVWQQFAAFRQSDFLAAYRQASTGFQDRCSVTDFADLARSEYPLVLRAARMEFGTVFFTGGEAHVPVYFFLPEGDVVPSLYRLIWEDGRWKINHVRVQKRWPANRRLGGLRV